MTALGRSACGLGSLGCIGIALFACWLGGADFLLVVGRTVAQPQVVALVVWSVAVLGSAVLLVPNLPGRRRRGVGRGGRRMLAVVGGIVAVSLVGTGVWCAGSALSAAGARALGLHGDTVLPAVDDRECTLSADESSGLRSSSGRLYAASAFGVAVPVGSWTADEMQLPVRDRNYSLEWRNGVGTLSFQTTRFIAPSRLEVTCRR